MVYFLLGSNGSERSFGKFDVAGGGHEILRNKPIDGEFGDELFGVFFASKGCETGDRFATLFDGDGVVESGFGYLDLCVLCGWNDGVGLVIFWRLLDAGKMYG